MLKYKYIDFAKMEIVQKVIDIKEYKREYYQKNKSRWNEYRVCSDCGGRYSPNSKSHHYSTKKHRMLKERKDQNEKIEELRRQIEHLMEKNDQFLVRKYN